MILGDLKKAIYSYVGRNIGAAGDTSNGDLVENSVDLCLLAINQARLTAQRNHDFVALESTYGASISKYGTSYDAFTTYPGGGSTVSMRTVKGVYEYALSSTNQIALAKKYDMQNVSEIDRVGGRDLSSERQFVYSFGRKLFLHDADATLVAVRGIALLADLTNAGLAVGTDFFLTHGHDWLMFQSIRQLQFLIKEDTRSQILDPIRNEAWFSLLKVDQDYESNWTDLD